MGINLTLTDGWEGRNVAGLFWFCAARGLSKSSVPAKILMVSLDSLLLMVRMV